MSQIPSALNVYQGRDVVVDAEARVTKPDYNVVIDAKVRQLPNLNVIEERTFQTQREYEDWAINRAAQPWLLNE